MPKKGYKQTEEHRKKITAALKIRYIKFPYLKQQIGEKLSKLLKGRKFSEEHKNKLSLAKKGKKIKPFSEEHKKKIREALKGHIVSKETIEKMSRALKGRKTWNKGKKGLQVAWNKGKLFLQIRGEKHPNWKGGITPQNIKIRHSIEFRLWREAVFARDNWTCQKCKVRGGRLHSHHIQNFSQYPELRFAIDNGITFCRNCHQLFHKIYGKTKNNKEQITQFIS